MYKDRSVAVAVVVSRMRTWRDGFYDDGGFVWSSVSGVVDWWNGFPGYVYWRRRYWTVMPRNLDVCCLYRSVRGRVDTRWYA